MFVSSVCVLKIVNTEGVVCPKSVTIDGLAALWQLESKRKQNYEGFKDNFKRECSAMGSQAMNDSSHILVRIKNTTVKCLLDSGSGTSILSSFTLNKLKEQVTPPKANDLDHLIAANGSHLKINGLCELILSVSGLKFAHSFYVCDKVTKHIILGRDLLKANNAIIDYQRGIVTFHDLVSAAILKDRDRNSFAKVAYRQCLFPLNLNVVFQSRVTSNFISKISC